MTYNRFLYNTALYNAGREEAGALIRSIIQAHTGPHIQAVVGGSPVPPANQSGISFISDFVIQEGSVKKPPAAYNFPDLAARIRGVRTDIDNLSASLFAQLARDLPAAIYLVNRIPDLPASIFGLLHKDLMAFILGELGQKDLAAILFVPQRDLAGTVFSQYAPDLGGRILGNTPGNLGARIWSPTDLRAIIASTFADDLPAAILGISFLNLPARMLGVASPVLHAYLKGFASATDDLPAATTASAPSDLPSTITATGGFGNLNSLIRAATAGLDDLNAYIRSGSEFDLRAIISFLGADTLGGIISAAPSGTRDRMLPAVLHGLLASDLAATLTITGNAALLNAFILALRSTADLGAFIRVAETFITAILTVTTLASRNLRATIGRPECEGGTAIKNLLAFAQVQHARDLGASIDSFIQANLGASVNSGNIIHAFDVIDVLFSPYKYKKNLQIKAVDTLSVRYSPFRGHNLGAFIRGELQHLNLRASISAGFPLPRVSPSTSIITAADLRNNEALNIQQVRLQMEGTFFEFLYVNGTDDAFIMDANQRWRINIRSFQPLAANLFGDHAAARICTRGDLTSFATIDEAVRSCISRVLGLDSQAQLGAAITSRGQISGLKALLQVSNRFDDLSAFANRVYPSDPLFASVNGTGGYGNLGGVISPIGTGGWGLEAWGTAPWGG